MGLLFFACSFALTAGSQKALAAAKPGQKFELTTNYAQIFAERKIAEEARKNTPKEPWESEIKEYLAKDAGYKLLTLSGVRDFTKKAFYIGPRLILKTAVVSSLLSLVLPFSLAGDKSTTASARIAEFAYHQEVGEQYRNPNNGMIDIQAFYKKTTTHIGSRKFKEPDVLKPSLFSGHRFEPEIIEQNALDGILAAFTNEDGKDAFFVLVSPESESTYKTYEVFPKDLSEEGLKQASKNLLGTYRFDLKNRSRTFEATMTSSAWGFAKTAFYTSIVGLIFVKLDEIMGDA